VAMFNPLLESKILRFSSNLEDIGLEKSSSVLEHFKGEI
jgi:hypothetical protein